jgi:hypothetical protein
MKYALRTGPVPLSVTFVTNYLEFPDSWRGSLFGDPSVCFHAVQTIESCNNFLANSYLALISGLIASISGFL